MTKLDCLYIEVDRSVAGGANEKVMAAIDEFTTEVERLNRFNEVQKRELIERISNYKSEVERLKAEMKEQLKKAYDVGYERELI